jgi:hypothetical protein
VYFEDTNTSLKELTTKLYDMRLRAKSCGQEVEKVIKRLMISFWGKSIQKETPIWKKVVPSEKIDKFIEFNQDFIYSDKKLNAYDHVVKLVKPIVSDYKTPQFACNVLTHSKISMMSLINDCISKDLSVLYVNTDCLTMPLQQFQSSQIDIGRDLGKFSYEVSSKLFIALGPYKNIHMLEDGTTRVRYHNKKVFNEVAFFEEQYKKLSNS